MKTLTMANALDEDLKTITKYLNDSKSGLSHINENYGTKRHEAYQLLNDRMEDLKMKIDQHQNNLKSIIDQQHATVELSHNALSESIDYNLFDVTNAVNSYKQMCNDGTTLSSFDHVRETNKVKEVLTKITKQMKKDSIIFMQQGHCEYIVKSQFQQVEQLIDNGLGYIRTLAYAPWDLRVESDDNDVNGGLNELITWIKFPSDQTKPKPDAMTTIYNELKITVKNQTSGAQQPCTSTVMDTMIKVTFSAQYGMTYMLEVKLYDEHVNCSPLMLTSNHVTPASSNDAMVPLPMSLIQLGSTNIVGDITGEEIQQTPPGSPDCLIEIENDNLLMSIQNSDCHMDSQDSEAAGFSAGVSVAAGARADVTVSKPTLGYYDNNALMSSGISETGGLMATSSQFYGKKVGGIMTLNEKFGGNNLSEFDEDLDLMVTVPNDEATGSINMTPANGDPLSTVAHGFGPGINNNDDIIQPAMNKPDFTSMMSPVSSGGNIYAIRARKVMTFGRGTKEDLYLPIGCEKNEFSDYFIVCDSRNNMVKAFKNNGQIKFTIGNGNGQVKLNCPSAVQCFNDGSFCVKDNCTIQHFDVRGKFIKQFGNSRKRLYGLTTSESGNLLTIEVPPKGGQNAMVLEFDYKRGKLVQSHRFDCIEDRGVRDSKCRFMDSFGSRVVVTDFGLSCAYVSTLNGKLLRKIGHGNPGDRNTPRKDNFFSVVTEPSGVAIDSAGNVFLGDSKNNRIQVFSVNGEWKGLVKIADRMRRPSGLSLTNDGHLIVSSYTDYNVCVFKLEKL